jgi:hypothetical protein
MYFPLFFPVHELRLIRKDMERLSEGSIHF